MSLAPLRRGEFERAPQLRGPEMGFASAVDRAKAAKPVPAARAREIDEWVRDRVKDHTLRFWKDDGAETAAKALKGDSDLGELTAAEQARLVDRVLRKWQGDGAASAQDLAGRVRGNRDLARLVADRLAARSVELQAGKRGDEKLDPALTTARVYAEAAVLALGYDPERPDFTAKLDAAGLRALVGSQSRDQASAFAAMLAHQPRALASAVSAMADAPDGEARDAFTLGAFAQARERTYFEALGLPQDMGRALARALGQPGEGERLGGILATPEGRRLLVEQLPFPQQGKTTPEARGQLLGLVLQHREITADVLQRSPGGDPWASPAVAKPMAQAAADQALQASGGKGHGIELAGAEALESRVARALGLRHEGEDGRTIDRIASAIRSQGGTDGKVTVLPIQFSSSESGAARLPLFRVAGKDGAVRFVDNQGGRYADFASWKRENRLPPGAMTYPRSGVLQEKDGRAVLDSAATPRTPDSFGEHVEEALDKAALFGGVVAGGAMVLGSGGTAAPAVVAGAGAWFAWRGAEEAGALRGHGLDQWDNPEYRMALFNTVAGGASILPFGRLAYLSQTGKAAEAGRVWSGLNGTAMAADGAAAANTGYTLATGWDGLSPGQRLEMGLGVALWGGMTLAVGRSGRASSADQPRADGTDGAESPGSADGPQVPLNPTSPLPQRPTWKTRAAEELDVGISDLHFVEIRRTNGNGEGVLADGAAVSPHEEVIRMDNDGREGRSIVLDMSDATTGNRRFAQSLADTAQAPVYLRREAGGWTALRPGKSTQDWSVEVEGRTLYRVDPDGARHRIESVEDHLGPRLGAGLSKTAFAFGDKAVVVIRDGDLLPGFKEMAMLNRLEEAGLPVARPLGLTRVGGQPALLVDRYAANSKDMMNRPGGEEVVDTSRLNRNSLSSLQRIKATMLERKIDIKDLQFLMKEDGSFVVADPQEIYFGYEPSWKRIAVIDRFIDAAEAKLGRHG
ncbi:DUF4781 domain-containing protein [Inquilinus sp. Marseille-Q2685]|uniref:DUF4781 domain-containing protein n=1 Tax=Inquilinus sp. Marseille-Q2685 TaxID=2866581 RepID=UPI001CE465C5|nr:DUF4781 domain-containing protein [Inquilinus sp. Marseille-Q2685]